MTAPTAVFTLGPNDRRRLLVDNEDGTYRELLATVLMPHRATVNVRTDDGQRVCLLRRQIIHAADPTAPVTPADDPLYHCVRGHRYRFIHHGPDGWVVETVGSLRRVLTHAVLVDVGHINLAIIARASILFAPEETP